MIHTSISYLTSLRWVGNSLSSVSECARFRYRRVRQNGHTLYFIAEKTTSAPLWSEPYWQHCGWAAKPWGCDIWIYTHPQHNLSILEEAPAGEHLRFYLADRRGLPVFGDLSWRSLEDAFCHLALPNEIEEEITMPISVELQSVGGLRGVG